MLIVLMRNRFLINLGTLLLMDDDVETVNSYPDVLHNRKNATLV